jgi:hypothetical protein
MNLLIYCRDIIVSLLSSLGLPYPTTVGLADISLVAIALGLLIATPELALVVAAFVLLAFLAGK